MRAAALSAAPLTRQALLPLILFQLSGALPPAVHRTAGIPRTYASAFCSDRPSEEPCNARPLQLRDGAVAEHPCKRFASGMPERGNNKGDAAVTRKYRSPLRLYGGLVEELSPPEAKGEGKQIPIDRQNSISEPEEEGKWRPMCRICYETDQDDLFAPCRCAGSMRYVHKECLRRWRAVKLGERGFTHCPMCDYKYKLRVSASLPPDSLAHNFARWLAQGECAIVSTLLCLLVALGGEALDALGWVSLFRWGSTLAETLAEGAGAGAGAGASGGGEMPVSSVGGDRVKEMVGGSPEGMIWRRLGYNWSVLAIMCGAAAVAPFGQGWRGGWGWLTRLREYTEREAAVRAAVTSVWVWWMVYAACEVVFIHLHRYPKALGCTLLMYVAVAVASVPLQIGIQMTVFEREQPDSGDVMCVDEAPPDDADSS